MPPKGLGLPNGFARTLGAFDLVMLYLFCALSPAAAQNVNPGAALSFPLQSASSDVRQAMAWVLQERDNRRMPFAIVDKKNARLFVFDGKGQFLGASAALLGLTPGDTALASNDDFEPTRMRPIERTTPAGRFVSEPGRNLKGEAIVWVDYNARLAIHRLRPAPPAEQREARLASESPDDNRISLGCVVVSANFYDAVVAPALGKSYGVVYVLPEAQPAQAMFGMLQSSLR